MSTLADAIHEAGRVVHNIAESAQDAVHYTEEAIGRLNEGDQWENVDESVGGAVQSLDELASLITEARNSLEHQRARVAAMHS